ncbi:ATP-binding cassette domain-containing protein [Salinicola endophyticus]|uniref:ABC-type dipeptide transporter n=1 Tax=Salinicola endophyticus TaxID=1949083 RepID=A0ABY8FF56_9GAMM|nr:MULTISPECIES: oligopeptide/dipeptide ABC transporter ATP-binding protein [Salinicola]WFF41458.1 ATP-binding cassette domain-containing protein [Salinicola endophyticus]
MALLDIAGLSVRFQTNSGLFTAVENVDIQVDHGDVLSIVGESGSGKSVSMLATMGLLPWTAQVSAERMAFDGQDLQQLGSRQRRRIVGGEMSMIFQEPMSSLNPCFTVGTQIDEMIKQHKGGSRRERHERALELLAQVGIPDPARRIKAYPHQLSGGMSQRVMIAMAISCDPRLLIADEPTTALDVTIQAQILELLLKLQEEKGMALILITHDMGVVAETAKQVIVQYAGRQVEQQEVRSLFAHPRHPYTEALLSALPERAAGQTRLPTIPGVVPGQHDRPTGCLFNPRCRYATERCREVEPVAAPDDPARTLCHYPLGRPDAEPSSGPSPGVSPETSSPSRPEVRP